MCQALTTRQQVQLIGVVSARHELYIRFARLAQIAKYTYYSLS